MSVRLFIGNLPYAANGGRLAGASVERRRTSASRAARRSRNGPPARLRVRRLRGSRGRRRGDPAIQPAAVQGTAASPSARRGPARIVRPGAPRPGGFSGPRPGGSVGTRPEPAGRAASRRAPGGFAPAARRRRRRPGARKNFGPDAPPKNKRKPPRKDSERGPKGPSRSVRSAGSTTRTRTGAPRTRRSTSTTSRPAPKRANWSRGRTGRRAGRNAESSSAFR